MADHTLALSEDEIDFLIKIRGYQIAVALKLKKVAPSKRPAVLAHELEVLRLGFLRDFDGALVRRLFEAQTAYLVGLTPRRLLAMAGAVEEMVTVVYGHRPPDALARKAALA